MINFIQKLRPVPSKLLQLLNSLNSIPHKRSQHSNGTFKHYTLFTSLAFTIWPMKKTKPIANSPAIEEKKPIIENADTLFENGHYEDCYLLLTKEDDQKNVEIQWRIARALYNMSKESKYDPSYKKELIYRGYDIVSNLLNSNYENFAVHKWYAVLLDTKSSYGGTKERILQLENVKKHMDLAVTLNPSDATILYMLGEWCFQISEMPWHQRKIAEVLFASPPTSNYEDALGYFLKAETVHPRFYSLNLLRIGKCYLKLQKDDLAKYYLKLAASYPAKSNEDHQANTEAADLLKTIK